MLAYDAYGKPRDPVLLLLHGPGQDRATWKGVAEALSDDHRVYCVDVPDHGDGGREAVLDFAAAMSLRRVCLIAHSPMAWSMAHEDVINRLVVEDSAPADLDLVPEITAPTLVLSGGAESGPPLREAAGLLQASEMVTIPVGHHIHRDAESTFVKVVSAFLDATRDATARGEAS
jgi:pimeloyl-ACP methyl ester carboxylesterase